MAETGDAQERTEQATHKRVQDARDKGQVARSRELSTMLVLLSGAATLYGAGDHLLHGLTSIMARSFALPRGAAFAADLAPRLFVELTLDALYTVAPVLVVALVVALAAPLALGGMVLSADAVLPNLERLDPLKGLKRVFGVRGVTEMLKALAKFVLILSFLLLALSHWQGPILALGQGEILASLGASTRLLFKIFVVVSAATVVVALVDVPLQLWQHAKQLRMSRQELRDEMKETDGSPELRGRVRAMQQEVARRRMMEEVPKADVVITNPEHYAVALKFDPETMRAPVLVAKGVEEVARHIRTIAAAHAIPVLEAPPLARAVYHTTKLNREIPAGLYVAVARVLAYVFQLRAGARDALPPAELPIPSELTY